MNDVYEITHSSFELKTVGDFIFAPGSPASRYINKEEEFLSIRNKEGKTNREAIISRFKSKRKLEEINKLSPKDIPIKVGTKLAIPVSKIDRIGLLTDGIQVVDNNVPAFKARALAELESKENYNPVRKLQSVGSVISGETIEIYPEITVWIWCRALSNTELSDEVDFNKGEIFNITPFVNKLTTSNAKGGGNFSLSLSPLMCEFDQEKDKWTVKKASYTEYRKDSKNTTQQGDGYYAHSSIVYEKDNILRRSQFLFHNIISPNDLVFIRFETLDLEKEQRIADNEDFVIHKSQIPGRIYDMIGLVDSNSQSVDGVHGDVNINIEGRDLSKLFIDDGTYFYALEMAQGQLNFAGGSAQENEYMQRVFMDSSLQYFNLYFNNSIENTFKFVIQQLSSIKIVPDDLFEYYGDRRNTRWSNLITKKERSAEINKQLQDLKHKGEEVIRNIREEKQITLSSSLMEERKIEEVWRNCLHFFKSERDREDEGKGEEQEYLYTSKRGIEKLIKGDLPLFAHDELKAKKIGELDQSLTTALSSYIQIDKTHPDFDEKTSIGPAKGIWQIIKLVIDQSVTERRVVDSSASSANGSLINFLRKVCQEPFVEFYTDTYGDMFHLIVRKPPINREGLISMLDGDVKVESQEGEVETYRSTIIDIEAKDVLQEQLSYNEQDVYSWYHLNPQSNFLGQGNTYSLAYLPAIFFKEYAEIWGSRPLNMTHNYMPKLPLNSNDSVLDVSEEQAFKDLAFLVESYVYMPFTRKGTITLNGDRRLKIGNICRYKPTGEIFFIDGVQQSFSVQENTIDRTTTIEVSRGMVEDLITGVSTIVKKTGDIGKDISYFKILEDTEPQIIKKTVIDKIKERVRVGTKKVKKYRYVDQDSGMSFETSQTKDAANSIRRTLKTLGYTEKNGQLDEAGFMTTRMAEIANSIFATIKQRYPKYNIRVTAGNDKYHKGTNSKHHRGAALDFVVIGATSSMLDNIVDILKEYKSRFKDFHFIDEYRKPSARSTGGHFHIEVNIRLTKNIGGSNTSQQKQSTLEPVSGGGFLSSIKRGYRAVKSGLFGNDDIKQEFKRKIGMAESGGNMYEKNGQIKKNGFKGQSAKGKYQIIDSTWNDQAKKFYKKWGRMPHRGNLQDNEAIMDLLLDGYETMLQKAGLEVNGTHLYALHFKGNTRWIAAAYQNPNANVATYFTTDEIRYNPTYMKGRTLGSVLNALAEKMSEPIKFKKSQLSAQPEGFESREVVGIEEWVEEDIYEDRIREVPRVVIQRELVFEKFVVNKESFNFFLKRRQNDPNYLGRTNKIEMVRLSNKKKKQ